MSGQHPFHGRIHYRGEEARKRFVVREPAADRKQLKDLSIHVVEAARSIGHELGNASA
jgi:hypothetical protein